MKYVTLLFDPAGKHAAIGAEKSGHFLMIAWAPSQQD